MRFDAILIDGMNTLYRAHYTAKKLTTVVDEKEIPVGGVYQFFRIILSVLERHAASKFMLVIAWEGGPDLVRHSLYSGYKKRERKEEIESQLSILQERLLPAARWGQARAPGWEADDVIATLANFFECRGKKVGILSGDHDLHQLVTDHVHVINPTSRPDLDDGISWRPRDVRRRWAVDPLRVPEVKALAGDPSDGIPGATGIGQETAMKLILQFQSLNGVVDAAKQDKLLKKNEVIVRDQAELRLFRELCTVNRGLTNIEWLKRDSDISIAKQFAELRFASLLAPSTLQLIKRAGA